MLYSLHKASPAHIAILNELIPISVRALSQAFYSEKQIEGAIGDIFGIDSQLVYDGTYYIAEVGDRVVACGGWSKRRALYGGDRMKAEEDNLLDPRVEAARIRAFFVDPEWARRGIGSRIMAQSEADAKSAGFQSMELVATLPGEQLYRRFGFAEISRYDHLLSNGEKFPVVSMRKSIA